MSKDKHGKQTVDMFEEINQYKVDSMTLIKAAYTEAVSNGSIRYRTTHTTPDGTMWNLVLEPQDKSLLGYWSYLGIASKSANTDFYLHKKFDSDTIHWGNYEPEDMFNLMKWDLDREWG